ncbi:MAG: uroporphyrinogen-III C-methyltransferase [Sedimentisphaerales bacterium]|nr:uroporphyrinogen-III C-methyltransferase [Sedimentisphaerales bacterium]
MVKKGFVYLVGAGPGRADLITVRGAELLKNADCIIYDKLANPALLKHARADAEIIHTPKRIGKGSTTQEEINKLLVEKASAGRIVVRLKGGDPCIFGRISEELEALNEAGINYEIVPGVTAGVAVSSYSGIMLTDRLYSSQVMFITGHEAEGKKDSHTDWNVLAKFRGTLVFYMGMGSLSDISEKLIENGLPDTTPAAVVSDVTFPTQRIIESTLANIHMECSRENIEPPALIIIGEAARNHANFNWFMKQPLFGKNIVITRDEPGNAEFADKITARGGNPVLFATFYIKPLTETNEFLQALTKFSGYDWIIFTSRNGVAVFFDALEKLHKDARVFASAKIACIGKQTEAKLNEFGIKADFVPSIFTGKEFGKQLINFTNVKGRKLLLLRSEIASDELAEILKLAGAEVDDVTSYTAVTQKTESAPLEEKIRNNLIDWVTFASPSAVQGFFESVNKEIIHSGKVKIASIGPVTSKELARFGANVNVTADEHTLDGLLDAIERSY